MSHKYLISYDACGKHSEISMYFLIEQWRRFDWFSYFYSQKHCENIQQLDLSTENAQSLSTFLIRRLWWRKESDFSSQLVASIETQNIFPSLINSILIDFRKKISTKLYLARTYRLAKGLEYALVSHDHNHEVIALNHEVDYLGGHPRSILFSSKNTLANGSLLRYMLLTNALTYW